METTGMNEKTVTFLERVYAKGAMMPAGTNLYGQYAFDPDKTRWTTDGFAAYMEVHPQIATAMFKVMDEDGDGTLTFDEFVKGYGFITRGDAKHRLELLFKIFDLDGSDTLDKGETKLMIRTILISFNEAAQESEGPGGTGIAAQAKLMKAKKAGSKMSPEKIAKQFEKEVDKVTSDEERDERSDQLTTPPLATKAIHTLTSVHPPPRNHRNNFHP